MPSCSQGHARTSESFEFGEEIRSSRRRIVRQAINSTDDELELAVAKVREMLSEDVIEFYYDLSQPGPKGEPDRVAATLASIRRDREMISCFQRQARRRGENLVSTVGRGESSGQPDRRYGVRLQLIISLIRQNI